PLSTDGSLLKLEPALANLGQLAARPLGSALGRCDGFRELLLPHLAGIGVLPSALPTSAGLFVRLNEGDAPMLGSALPRCHVLLLARFAGLFAGLFWIGKWASAKLNRLSDPQKSPCFRPLGTSRDQRHMLREPRQANP